MENLDSYALGGRHGRQCVVCRRENPRKGPRKPTGPTSSFTAAPKAKIAEHLRFMASADLNPSVITLDGMALFSVSPVSEGRRAQVPRANMAIIDVGASKTTLCLVHEGRPVLLRTLLWGRKSSHPCARRSLCLQLRRAERRKRTMVVQEVDAWSNRSSKSCASPSMPTKAPVHQRLTHCWVSAAALIERNWVAYGAATGLAPVGRGKVWSSCPRAFSIAFGLAIHSEHCPDPRWKSRLVGSSRFLDFKAGSDAASATTGCLETDRQLTLWGGLIWQSGALWISPCASCSRIRQSRNLKHGLQAQYEQSFGPARSPW